MHEAKVPHQGTSRSPDRPPGSPSSPRSTIPTLTGPAPGLAASRCGIGCGIGWQGLVSFHRPARRSGRRKSFRCFRFSQNCLQSNGPWEQSNRKAFPWKSAEPTNRGSSHTHHATAVAGKSTVLQPCTVYIY